MGRNQLTHQLFSPLKVIHSKKRCRREKIRINYDPDGNLTSDKNKGINNIKYNHLNLATVINFGGGNKIKYFYNASGLVTEVQHENQPKVKFYYNDKGHRVRKESFTNGTLTNTSYYIRDAGGSTLAIYNNTALVEQPIYGASRLGVHYRSTNTDRYQLTDHLGNVRAVIARNNPTPSTTTDYYPGGMAMPGRKTVGGELYRYGYQGEFAETDPETGKPMFQLRLYDPRINRWLSPDPKGEFHSPYLSMGNNWMNKIVPDGGSIEEPPVNGLAWFYDDTGDYYWNEFLGTYEHYSSDEGSFVGYYRADEFALPVGDDFGMYFESGGGKKALDTYNPEHTPAIAQEFLGLVGRFGSIEEITNQDMYPGVKIYKGDGMHGGITLGNIIIVEPAMDNIYDIGHEYGHFLDFKYHFKYNFSDYLDVIGFPSFKSAFKATFFRNHHHSSASEIRADILGGAYHNLKLYSPK